MERQISMPQGTVPRRNMGLELLRIMSMLMVVVLHVLGKGGVLAAVEPLSAQYHTVWFLEISAYCAVNCYGLLSGYLGHDASFRYGRIVPLYATVVFYAVGSRLFFAWWMPGSVGWVDIVKALFPFAFDLYWYFTAYFCLFFCIPFLNRLVNGLDRAQALRFMVTLTVLFSVLPTLVRRDLFHTQAGYSALWLIILYLLGACMKKCSVGEGRRGGLYLGIYGTCVLITFFTKVIIELVTAKLPGGLQNGNFLVSYCSPTILLAAAALLVLFSKLRFDSRASRLIGWFAPLAFSVYLIHTEPYVWTYLFSGRFQFLANLHPVLLPFGVVGSAVTVWLVCSLLDALRRALFRRLSRRSL